MIISSYKEINKTGIKVIKMFFIVIVKVGSPNP